MQHEKLYLKTYIFDKDSVLLVKENNGWGPIGGEITNDEDRIEKLDSILKDKTGLDVSHVYEKITDDMPKTVSFNYRKDGEKWNLILEFLSETDSLDDLDMEDGVEYQIIDLQDLDNHDFDERTKEKVRMAKEQYKELTKR